MMKRSGVQRRVSRISVRYYFTVVKDQVEVTASSVILGDADEFSFFEIDRKKGNLKVPG